MKIQSFPPAYLAAETAREVSHMLEDGMEQISRRELDLRLEAAGYHIDSAACHNYVNTANAITYKARSMGYRHTASGMRYAHIDAPKDTLPALQEIRRNCFVVHAGRIWEL